jgi:uncharacterized protein YheU (UPF0270 family)
MTENTKKEQGLIIPVEKLSSSILSELISEFVLREGTDYGHGETSLDLKKEQVFKQLQSKEVLILFDINRETTTLMRADSLKKQLPENYEIVDPNSDL